MHVSSASQRSPPRSLPIAESRAGQRPRGGLRRTTEPDVTHQSEKGKGEWVVYVRRQNPAFPGSPLTKREEGFRSSQARKSLDFAQDPLLKLVRVCRADSCDEIVLSRRAQHSFNQRQLG